MTEAAAPKAKKAAKPKVPVAHPPILPTIPSHPTTEVKVLADKKGSSRQDNLKHVVANNNNKGINKSLDSHNNSHRLNT